MEYDDWRAYLETQEKNAAVLQSGLRLAQQWIALTPDPELSSKQLCVTLSIIIQHLKVLLESVEHQ